MSRIRERRNFWVCHPVIYLMAAAEAQIAQKQFIVDLTKFLWKTAVSKNKYVGIRKYKLKSLPFAVGDWKSRKRLCKILLFVTLFYKHVPIHNIWEKWVCLQIKQSVTLLVARICSAKKAISKDIGPFYCFYIIKTENVNNNKRLELLSKFVKK